MVSRLKGEKSEGGCGARFLAGETSGLTNPIPEPSRLCPFREVALYHHPGHFLDDLDRGGGGDPGRVARGVEFHDVEADDPGLERVDEVDRLARRQAARLLVGDAGGKGRVERIQVEGDIKRILEAQGQP